MHEAGAVLCYICCDFLYTFRNKCNCKENKKYVSHRCKAKMCVNKYTYSATSQLSKIVSEIK